MSYKHVVPKQCLSFRTQPGFTISSVQLHSNKFCTTTQQDTMIGNSNRMLRRDVPSDPSVIVAIVFGLISVLTATIAIIIQLRRKRKKGADSCQAEQGLIGKLQTGQQPSSVSLSSPIAAAAEQSETPTLLRRHSSLSGIIRHSSSDQINPHPVVSLWQSCL